MKQPHSSPSTPRAERGQGLVEFALILPLLLGLLLGIIDFARLFFIYSEVSSGAREAIRFGAVNDNHKQCDQIRQRARSTVTLANINAVNFTVSLDHGDIADTYFTYSADCSGSVPSVAVGDRITVRVQTQVELITANILGSVLRRTFGAMPIDYTTSRTIVPLEGIATGPTSTPLPTRTPPPGSVTDTPTPTPSPTFTPTPPPAPLNFDATVQFTVCPIDNNNPVDFTWITVPGAIGYRIYQDGTNRLIADTSNPPCDNCDNLGTSQFRQYYAVAYNAGGESARSNPSSVSCGAGATDTPTPTPTPTNTPTNTPTPTPSNTPTPSMTLIPSRTPTPSATPCPTTLCTPTPTLNPLTPTPTPADEMLMNFMSGYPAAKTSGPPTTRKFWVKVRLTDTVGNPITDAVVTIVDPAAYFGWSLTHLGSGIYGGNSGASGTCFSGNTTVDILVTVRALKAGYTTVEVSDRTDGRASDVCP